MLRLFSISKYIFYLFVFLFFSASLRAEKIKLVFLSEAGQDSFYSRSKTLNKTSKGRYVCILDRFDSKDRFTNEISFFNPKLVNSLSDSFLVANSTVIITNIRNQTDSSLVQIKPYKIIELSDTLKIAFVSFVSPDFPQLFPEISKGFSFRFDIFACAEEAVDGLKSQGVDVIIANNYMGKYLSEEIWQKNPEIDFIADSFEDIEKQFIKKSGRGGEILLLNYNNFDYLIFEIEINKAGLGSINLFQDLEK